MGVDANAREAFSEASCSAGRLQSGPAPARILPSGAVLMPEVDSSRIDSSAVITGASLIEGPLTRIGPGVRIHNAHLCNVVVEEGARIDDSTLVSEDGPAGHRPHGFASRWAIPKRFPAVVGAQADIAQCTLRNACVGARSVLRDAQVGDGQIGEDNRLQRVYAQTVFTGRNVVVEGPTELSEAWLGHHARIDACGYFEGAFSNDLYAIEFDRAAGSLRVKEILNVPHASRYGMNTINSTNSGNLFDQPDGRLRSLGRRVGLWHDALLSHEPIVLGPCCWVAGWTKVIGKSARVHGSADEFVSDLLATHLMPFSVSGLDGASVTGQVAPGELFNGLIYKQREAAWAFAHAPDAVIEMVRRVAELAGDTALADRLVELSLSSALALVEYQAHTRQVDLDRAGDRLPRGWAGWLIAARNTLRKHLDSGLWAFRNAEPLHWRLRDGRWTPADPERLRAIAPDALDCPRDEQALIRCELKPLPRRLGVAPDELSGEAARIDPAARVSPTAFVGPGVRILGPSVVGDRAWLWRATVDRSTVGSGAVVSRSLLCGAEVGADSRVVSSALRDSALAEGSSCVCARLEASSVRGRARISPYAEIVRSRLESPCIVGSTLVDSTVDSICMSYHMPGQVEHLAVEPSYVTRDGHRIAVRAIPMLGGGLRVLGRADAPVRIACSFIGSNAILEAGARVGFGCFVLDRLTGSEGLPPFTISTAPGPERDEIGMVVHRFANVVITHFVSWAYQALGPDEAELVGLLVPSYLREGRDAVRWAMEQRAAGTFDTGSPFARYKSLRLYSEPQLKAGLESYELALSDGRWEMGVREGELRFTGPGVWVVAEGAARWAGATEARD